MEWIAETRSIPPLPGRAPARRRRKRFGVPVPSHPPCLLLRPLTSGLACVASGICHPFTAPTMIPFVKKRCPNRKINSMGRVITTDPAISRLQLTTLISLNFANATGSV